MRHSPLRSLLLALVWTACTSAPPAPVDTAATRLREALDSEALFTIAGGLKPVSCGFWHTSIQDDAPEPPELLAVREQLASWRDDDLWADVLVFHEAHGGRRAAQAFVADRAAVARTLERHAAFFAPLGLDPAMHPGAVFAAAEGLDGDDRHRALGLLFGYPEHAVDFFVAAQHERTADGRPFPRRFVQIPTHGAPTGRFVYAVPEDHVDNDADLRLRAAAAAILARYRALLSESRPDDLAALRRILQTLRAEFASGPQATSSPGIDALRVHGFDVRLVNGFRAHALHDAVMAVLADHLFRITRVVAEPALARLRAIPIWVGFEDERHAKNCMFYHPNPRWLEAHDYPVELAGGVEIANARNFLGWTLDQPWMVLHELAHGFHHQVLGHGHPGIRAAFGAAKQQGLYEQVLRIGGSVERHYALTNDQEYFAEASEAYFGTNDFYPYVRSELRQHDPRGFGVLEEAWGGRRR